MKMRKLLFAAITAMSVMLFNSCEEDACKDVNCGAYGACVAGICDCDTGYEGSLCETVSRDKFIGTFSITDACSASGAGTYTCTIIASSTAVDKVLISNFWDGFTNNVIATISNNTITIADQEPDTDGFRVTGSGTITGNVISLNYSVVDTSTNDTDVCQSTWTKQ